jgi:hypothetical protein
MNVAGLLDPRQVLGRQHSALTQVGAEIVHEHAADHVLFPGVGAQSMSPH